MRSGVPKLLRRTSTGHLNVRYLSFLDVLMNLHLHAPYDTLLLNECRVQNLMAVCRDRHSNFRPTPLTFKTGPVTNRHIGDNIDFTNPTAMNVVLATFGISRSTMCVDMNSGVPLNSTSQFTSRDCHCAIGDHPQKNPKS